MTRGTIYVSVFVGLLLFAMMGCNQPPQMATVVDLDVMRRMLAVPDLTAEQWQAECDPENTREHHCTLQVVVECPPDCGVYRILRNDKLLRRMW